ncbi:SOS response-associated peptidase [Marinobacter lipolyticus]|uniref:SOS response-associated peptidase n=1 Tax=Marinobacter lipolyticus TaxID=209639 RepID=UPI001BCB8575|nr:SOS response-associated peptidase [Marinobacter lipolyticus]MBS8239522.1 SOS response-associated peptidase [Marinobacter lipolyticus]
MCGRFTFYTPPDTLILEFFPEGMEVDGKFGPSYNIPPGVGIPMIRSTMNGTLVMAHSHWGFRPVWAEGKKAPTPINARAETVATSAYFRDAFAEHRCLIPANGWYEWKQSEGAKTPYYITSANSTRHSTLFFAGLWTPREGDDTTACAIITEPASEPLKHIHDRQPVVLEPDCLRDWLNPALTERPGIRAATHRLDATHLQAYVVSDQVNNPRHDSAELIRRV